MKIAYKALLILSVLPIMCGCKDKEYNSDDVICNSSNQCYDKEQNPITGTVKKYYKNGKLESEIVFKGGMPNGTARMYYENGNLKYEATLKNGKDDGITKAYYANGNLEAVITFKDGMLNGTARKYYENGNLMNQATFKDGEHNGLLQTYDENGKEKESINYKDGKRTTPDQRCMREKQSQKNMLWLQCLDKNVNPSYLSAYQKMEGMKACQYLMDHLYDSCYY